MDVVLKDPEAVLDYGQSWATWLVDGDTIVTSEWIVPDGLTMTNESNTATITTVWLSGGTVGSTYTVTNRITTAQGRTDDRSILIVVRDR